MGPGTVPTSLKDKLALAIDRAQLHLLLRAGCRTSLRLAYKLTEALFFFSCLGFHSFSLAPGQRKLPAVKVEGLAQESPAGPLTSFADEKCP